MDFSHHSRHIERPELTLPHGNVKSQSSAKYLGVILVQHLGWSQQYAYAIEKGTAWTLHIRCIARLGWGITPKYARKLFIGVALPKVLYGAEVWNAPPATNEANSGKMQRGTVAVIMKLASTQRAGAIDLL